tara:strand:- start:80 stop:700 length:621 start_codon:yes stop_codon:yes gene_type:complete
MHDLFLQNFLKAFVAIDPISLIPILTIITQGLNTKKTIKLSGFVFLITCGVLIFFSLYGNSFLVFMGISISSFQIIGGFFLLIISYEMVFEKRVKRKATIANELIDEHELNNLAVFPISIPLVAGPSAITLSVLISKDINYTMVSFYTQIFPLVLTLFLTSIIIIFSNFFMKLFNKTIMNVLQKLFGLILGALAVEYVIRGWNLTT